MRGGLGKGSYIPPRVGSCVLPLPALIPGHPRISYTPQGAMIFIGRIRTGALRSSAKILPLNYDEKRPMTPADPTGWLMPGTPSGGLTAADHPLPARRPEAQNL